MGSTAALAPRAVRTGLHLSILHMGAGGGGMSVPGLRIIPNMETQVSTVERIRELEARADAAEAEAIACKY